MPRQARTRLPVLVLLALALGLGPAAPAGALSPRETARELARHMRPAGGASGALVVDLGTGAEVFSRRARAARIPASTQKLVATTSALLRLGASRRLRTEALASRPLRLGGTLAGDLYLRGGGDPTLTTATLQALADDLASTGLARVTGRVLGDESAFDDRRGVPSSGYAISADIGAQLGALIVDGGRTGRVRPYYQADPAAWAATRFARALRRAGVRVAARGAEGTAPPGAILLGFRASPTVAQLARLVNVPSDNFMAEMLLKAVAASTGRRGTTARGASVAESTLAGALGVRPRAVDGSGLSRSNRMSPSQTVRLLRRMTARDEGDALFDSLAVMGRSGTLRDRLRSSVARDRCRGKTGTLRDVSALSGYCRTRTGERLAFSILMNRVYPPGARALQDRMVSAIARYDSSGP